MANRKKVTVSYKWSRPEYSAIIVPAYLSDIAGLCVTHTHRLKVNHKENTVETVILRSWDIVHYPFGQTVLQGYKSKQDALDGCAKLAKFSWVCLFKEDFEKNNDMKAVRKLLMEIRRDDL